MRSTRRPRTDADGKPYDGANKYVIHFEKGQMPPANAFWSLTMYNADYFFVENPLDRYTVSSRTRFKPNNDGSVDIYIQNESPGQGQGAELAAGAEGQVRADAADVLAARETAVASSTARGSRRRSSRLPDGCERRLDARETETASSSAV